MKTDRRKKILLVEDHPLFRGALRQLVNKEPDLTVCGEAGDPREAITLMQETHPDMAIVDITLGHNSGIDLMKQMRALDEDLPVLVISMHDESLYAERVLRAGGRGYLMKHEAPEQIRSAIRQILAGGLAFTNKSVESLLRKMADGQTAAKTSVAALSDRELEIFQLVGRGIGTRQIAETLHLSIPTINSFRARIKEKLNITTASELTFQAVRWVQQQDGKPT